MPLLGNIAGRGADAMDPFKRPSLDDDVDLAEAKRRLGDRACVIS